ncbi:GNAT family N-acetyltransferase [Ktedonobacter robiniae]|uniref:N-acetyltransferase domain-containing protein n=1 Tax=Ktedonobacter robiniae TaxID=2778365 RepID=A0ABQ3UZH5_9CHLR|nr:GNAT family N-acetyltransferase [Ktedonobacter robiniae]GHO58073.1 hypothetical protein KSB_65480 [Ktedonobacter robiniae]
MTTNQGTYSIGDRAGLLWTWWKGDALPVLPPLPDFSVERAANLEELAFMMETTQDEVLKLRQVGHEPYLARIGAHAVAVGWSATGKAAFGGGLITFQVPPQNRYLYYFITLPAWRGHGIYPRLLQYILRHECATNERFWIIHQAANLASQRGIERAGFQLTSAVHFLDTGGLGLLTTKENKERALTGAALFGLPLIESR